MLLWSQGKGVHIDTGVRSASVVLVRLDKIEVSTLTLREAILAIKLKLSGDNRVLTPAVEVKRSLREDESTGIRNTRVLEVSATLTLTITRSKVGLRVVSASAISVTLGPPVSIGNINGTSLGKQTRSVDV
jgi:hypothetical protein